MSEIYGEWRLKLSEFIDDNNCKVAFPINGSTSYDSLRELKFKRVQEFTIQFKEKGMLEYPSINTNFQNLNFDVIDPTNCEDSCQSYWTMIYDEGIQFEFNGFSFQAFFRFKETHDPNVSIVTCSKTFVGWSKTKLDSNKTGCFTLEKVNEEIVEEVENKTVKKTHIASNSVIVHGQRVRMLSGPVLSMNQKIYNPNESQYKAYVMESKDTKFVYNEDERGQPLDVNWEELILEAEDQGRSGNCYIYSTKHMLNARAKLLSNGQDIDISVEHLMTCNYMSQGNDGGFSIEVMNYLRYDTTMSNSCWEQADGNCKYVCNDPSIKISKFGYIGGYYGNTNELDMMKELQNGPIVINYDAIFQIDMDRNPGDEDYVYQPSEDWVMDYDRYTNHYDGWERVVHSVLIYGYGVNSRGVKFWRMQNSWGRYWNSNGRVNVIRGIDSMGIESNAEFGVPIIIDKENLNLLS